MAPGWAPGREAKIQRLVFRGKFSSKDEPLTKTNVVLAPLSLTQPTPRTLTRLSSRG